VLERELGEYFASSEVREIITRLKARNQVHREVVNARQHDDPLLCVGNGVVNLQTREFLDHSPDYHFVRGLDVDHEPAEAEPEKIEGFLDEVTQRIEDRDTLLDHLAHGLMPGHPYRAFVVCYGPGGNGKTQVSELFRGFVGSHNAAAVEIDELSNGDFATGDLPGTFLNWGDDMAGDGGGQLSDLSLLKKATGGSEIRANEKYEKTFDFKNEAAMFFSANEPPRIGEQKASIQDRIYPIEMPYRFKSEPDPDDPLQKEKTPNISKGLLEDDGAMKGLLLLAIKHAQELIESRGEYSQPESPEERLKKYNRSADPIVKFAGRALEEAEGEYKIRKDDAHRVYRDMAESWEERPASLRGFKRQLPGATTFDVETAQSRALANSDDGEDRVRCWKRVRWTESARKHMPDWLADRYSDHFEDEMQDSGETDEPEETAAETPLATRECGYGHEFTASVENWSDGEYSRISQGLLRDHTGAETRIGFVVPGGNEDPLEGKQGKKLKFENVTIRKDGDGLKEAVINDATTVTPASEVDKKSNDDEDNEDNSSAGGSSSKRNGSQDDGDKGRVNEKVKNHLLRYIRDQDDLAEHDSVVAAVAGMIGGVSPAKVEHRIEELKRSGDIYEPMSEHYRTT
jgi:putative DNA primase/helicase